MIPLDQELETLRETAKYFDNISKNQILQKLENEKMYCYIPFYIAKYGNWIDFLIDIYTNIGKGENDLGLSHNEIIFTKTPPNEIKGSSQLCFSSSGMDGGCRWKRITMNDHWEIIDVTKYLEEKNISILSLLNKIYPEEGKKYDYLGLFFMELFHTKIHDKNKWYCSEIVMYLLELGYSDDPNVLYNILIKITEDRNKHDTKYRRKTGRES